MSQVSPPWRAEEDALISAHYMRLGGNVVALTHMLTALHPTFERDYREVQARWVQQLNPTRDEGGLEWALIQKIKNKAQRTRKIEDEYARLQALDDALDRARLAAYLSSLSLLLTSSITLHRFVFAVSSRLRVSSPTSTRTPLATVRPCCPL